MHDFDYQPYYCEENAYRLSAKLGAGYVVIISNLGRACALWGQRAAEPGEPVFWDYHVVVVAEPNVWDLDCVAGLPISAETWWAATFPYGDAIRTEYLPSFRVLSETEFRIRFSSDRSHMKGPNGEFLKPPPSWPAIHDPVVGHKLGALLDFDARTDEIMDFQTFEQWLKSGR